MKKIAICGISGSGKTTLMKNLSLKLALPIITNSIIELAKKYDQHIMSHKSLLDYTRNNPGQADLLQLEFIQQRIKSFQSEDYFISDRSTIDNWVYYSIQNLPFSNNTSIHQHLYSLFIDSLKHYTHIIYLDSDRPIALDGKRIDSPFLYTYTNMVFKHYVNLIYKMGYNVININYQPSDLYPTYVESVVDSILRRVNE